MKSTFIFFVLINFNLDAQDSLWYEYEFDENINIQFPTLDVYQEDSIVNDQKYFEYSAYKSNSSFFCNRLTIAERSNYRKVITSLPDGYNDLMKFYDGVTKGIEDNSKFYSKKEIPYNDKGLYGRRLTLSDSLKNKFYEVEYYIIENYLYSFIYQNYIDFNEAEKEIFLASIKIKNVRDINQALGDSKNYEMGQEFGRILFKIFKVISITFLILLVFGFIIYIFKKKI